MTRNGTAYQLAPLVQITAEIEYGLWPTPKASDGDQYSRNLDYFKRRYSVAPDLPVIVGLSTPPTPSGCYGKLNPDWIESLMGFPIGFTDAKG